MAKLPIYALGKNRPPDIAVRIERCSDNKFFDPADGVFKLLDQIAIPYLPLMPYPGRGNEQIARIDLEIDAEQFTDGAYIIYFHDMLLSEPFGCIDIKEIVIIRGNWTPLSATEIAWRVLESQVGLTTLRETVKEIKENVDWLAVHIK